MTQAMQRLRDDFARDYSLEKTVNGTATPREDKPSSTSRQRLNAFAARIQSLLRDRALELSCEVAARDSLQRLA